MTQLDVSAILDRIREVADLDSDTDLALRLELTPGALGNWRRRNTLDLELIAKHFPDMNLDWIVFGRVADIPKTHEAAMEYFRGFTLGESLRTLAAVADQIDELHGSENHVGRLPINAKTLEHDREELEKIPIVRESSEALERKKAERARTGIDPLKEFEDQAKKQKDRRGAGKPAKNTSHKRGTQTGN